MEAKELGVVAGTSKVDIAQISPRESEEGKVPLNPRQRYLESLELYPSGTTNDKSVH